KATVITDARQGFIGTLRVKSYDGAVLFCRIIDMEETLPDRLSIDPSSPHFKEDLVMRGVGIRFNGVEKTNVEEYCISEGWIRVSAGGKSRDRRGRPLTVKMKGTVEAFLKEEEKKEEKKEEETKTGE